MRNYLLSFNSFYDRCLEGYRLRLHYRTRTVKTTSVHQILTAYSLLYSYYFTYIRTYFYCHRIYIDMNTFSSRQLQCFWINQLHTQFFIITEASAGCNLVVYIFPMFILWVISDKTHACSILLSDVSEWDSLCNLF